MKKLLLFALVLFVLPLQAQTLFEYEEQVAFAQTLQTHEGVLSSERRIVIDPEVLRYPSFVLQLDGHEPAYRESIEDREAGFVSRFRVGAEEAVSTVTSHNGYVAGTVFAFGKVFEISPAGEGYVLREYTGISLECGAVHLSEHTSLKAITTSSPSRRRAVSRRGLIVSSFRIDVAEGYMGTAAAAVGGKGQMEAIIQNAVDTLNTVVRNSSISNVEFKLVGMREFQFDDTNGITTLADILSRLASHTEFNSWRDSLGADIGGMWISRRMSAAYIPYGTSFGRAVSYHFTGSTSLSQPVVLIYSHEVGHNMGMEHDRENANVNDPNAANYGWYDCMAGWATIMTYQNQVCRNLNVAEPTRIPYFSNPEIRYNGISTGISKANNAAQLIFAAPYVAAYSPSRSN